MFKFGEEWDEEMGSAGSPASPASPASPNRPPPPRSFAAPAWAGTAILVVSVIAFIAMLSSVFSHAGQTKPSGAAHSLVFIFEGFKGTAFDHVVMGSNKAPNLKKLVRNHAGQYAACISANDARCAGVQSGPRQGDQFRWDSAPGIASILSGVNSNKHRVNNDSHSAMSEYSRTSKEYPSFLKIATEKGLRTVVVGGPQLLSSAMADTGSCSNYGVLDYECDTNLVLKCAQTSSCNANTRISVPLPAKSEANDNTAEEYDGGLEALDKVLEERGADIVVVHVPILARAVADGARYSEDSDEYIASIYLLDAYVGKVLAVLEERVERAHETWLVAGTSDHGGKGNNHGTNLQDDEVVPFFATTVIAGGKLNLNSFTLPTRQYDMAPTILRWHGLLTDELALSMDGRVQGICSEGKKPVDCLAAKTEEKTGVTGKYPYHHPLAGR